MAAVTIAMRTLRRDAKWKDFLTSVIACCWSHNSFPAKFMIGNTVSFVGEYSNTKSIKKAESLIKAHEAEEKKFSRKLSRGGQRAEAATKA